MMRTGDIQDLQIDQSIEDLERVVKKLLYQVPDKDAIEHLKVIDVEVAGLKKQLKLQ